MSDFTLAIIAAVAMALLLATIAYSRGNVPGGLAAIYCLLLTVGCLVIFYRTAPHSPATSIAMQATVSRQRLTGTTGSPCATLGADKSRPMPVREIICSANNGADCTVTVDVPTDQVRALPAAGQALSVSAFVACQ